MRASDSPCAMAVHSEGEGKVQSYVPVEPVIDGQGDLTSLVNLLGRGNAQPIAADPEDALTWKLNYYQTSLEIAARLGIASVFSFSAGYLDSALICDISVHQAGYALGDLGNRKVSATYWGGCVRLAMRIRSASASAGLTLPVLAASVEARLAEVQYEIAGVGAGAAAFAEALESVPLSGSFDFDVFSRLNLRIKAMVDAMKAELKSTPAVPVGVDLVGALQEDLLGEAASVRHAMLSISNGLKLKDSLTSAKGEVDPALITGAYVRILGKGNEEQSPTDDHKGAARRWLSK
jgi:hypothetical protein